MPVAPCPNDDAIDASSTAIQTVREIEAICLVERATQSLRRSGYSALQDLGITVREDVVILYGAIPSYYLKQLAQEIIRKVVGARAVRNQLKVA